MTTPPAASGTRALSPAPPGSDDFAGSIKYPRRRVIRRVLQVLAGAALGILTDFHVVGMEHFPKTGPLLVVANHFSFIDPVAVIRIAPWAMEFVGGFTRPNAPGIVAGIPALWGFYPVFRGTGARDALRAAEVVLGRGGTLGIFPEGTSAASVLRSPRLGASLLAATTGAQILPIGLDGLVDVFPKLRRGQRSRVTVRVGEPFGPFTAPGRGRERRVALRAVGDEIMSRLAALLPPERRGLYSDDPALREAARALDDFPWDASPEV